MSTDNEGSRRQTLKRPRPVVSCLDCRRKKLKCDRLLPCQQCTKSGLPDQCTYAPGQEPAANARGRNGVLKRQRLNSPTQEDTVPTVIPPRFDDLQARIDQLERLLQLQQSRHSAIEEQSPPADIATEGLNAYMRTDTHRFEQGQYHLSLLPDDIISQFGAVQSFVNHLGRDDVLEEICSIATDLSELHVITRQHPLREIASYGKIVDVLAHMQQLLPDTTTCITLIELYFQYFENCFRVLHRHTSLFRLRALLDNSLSREERDSWLPVLLSVVSIASSLNTLPECDLPQLHGEVGGVGAYQLIRNYLSLLSPRKWTELSNIQVAVLSLQPHKSCPLKDLESWNWSGNVLRRAMAARVHDHHSTSGDIFETEMKRRLWLTILEFDLTLAIASNTPASCPRWQGPSPMSVNDEELQPGMTRPPRCKNVEAWTDGVCQYVLARSYNDRLQAYSLVSSGTTASYATVLQHTRHLEQIIHDLPQFFRLGSPDEASNRPHRLLAQMELDLLLRRPLDACYAPYAADMPADDRYKEARIPWIQSCTFGACFQDLFDPKYPLMDLPRPEGLWDFYYSRYSWDTDQFLLANCLELQRLRSLNPSAVDVASPEFCGHTLRSLAKVKGWTIESITKSIEEGVHPLIRRIGKPGSSLRDLVRWVAILGSLRDTSTCSRHAIKNELQSLIASLKGRFAQQLDRVKTKSCAAKAGWDEKRKVKWLQRYLLQHEDDHDLDAKPPAMLGNYAMLLRKVADFK